MRSHIGYATALVFQALAEGNEFGLDIIRSTGLPSGTVYPTLTRAEASGLVRSKWERRSEAAEDGRPRRRYYELTATGRKALAGAAVRFAGLAAAVHGPSKP